MEQYIDERGKPVWKDVSLEDALSKELFYEVPDQFENDQQWAFHSNIGSITVLDRTTGCGYRDTETGYRDPEGKFWLASCGHDVRWSGVASIGEAIEWVKDRANTCVGM